MEFKKYQHIERLGTVETEGILDGKVYIFPKIDGTNSSVWLTDDGQIGCGSRNRQLSLDNDNAGFMGWAVKQENLKKFLNQFPGLILYGEWLVPHTLKTYEDRAWRNFYVFDVWSNKSNGYLDYEYYRTVMEAYGIPFIPPLVTTVNPIEEKIISLLDKNVYLIKDGCGTGEGIVIKNYDYQNRFGRQTWAKVVRNEFKAKHWQVQPTEVKSKETVEQRIVDKFITESLVSKEFAKIQSGGGWSSKMIPRLLNTVYYCLVKEEAWNFVKEHKNPKIDFKRLMNLTYRKTKELKPEIF